MKKATMFFLVLALALAVSVSSGCAMKAVPKNLESQIADISTFGEWWLTQTVISTANFSDESDRQLLLCLLNKRGLEFAQSIDENSDSEAICSVLVVIYDGYNGSDEWQRLTSLCCKALLKESETEKSAKSLRDILWDAKYVCGLNNVNDDFIIIKERFITAVKNELSSATLTEAEKLGIFADLAGDTVLTSLVEARINELK